MAYPDYGSITIRGARENGGGSTAVSKRRWASMIWSSFRAMAMRAQSCAITPTP